MFLRSPNQSRQFHIHVGHVRGRCHEEGGIPEESLRMALQGVAPSCIREERLYLHAIQQKLPYSLGKPQQCGSRVLSLIFRSAICYVLDGKGHRVLGEGKKIATRCTNTHAVRSKRIECPPGIKPSDEEEEEEKAKGSTCTSRVRKRVLSRHNFPHGLTDGQ